MSKAFGPPIAIPHYVASITMIIIINNAKLIDNAKSHIVMLGLIFSRQIHVVECDESESTSAQP